MTFTPNIPQSGQSLGQTQAAILNNFENYFNTMGVNHVPPNGAGGYPQGKHTFAEFVSQAQSPATASSEVSTYCRTISAVPELCIQKAGQLANAADVQMTRLDTGALAANNGYSFLPGGLIIQWGQNLGATNNLSQNYAIPFTSVVYSLVVSGGVTSGTQPTINFNPVALGAGSLTSFIWKIANGPCSATWIAIGK